MSEARPLGAAELLRSVGLLADGPAVYGSPIRAAGPGVYVVELAAPLPSPPIDLSTVGRWIERVPGLTLDDVRPIGKELAGRLASFWLPEQTVLYIGASTVSVSSRVAAAARTPLGDRKPYSGGHWLRTLREPERLRVWWATTDAAEEYEDALLAAFAAGVPPASAAALRDASVLLPWANLQAVTAERKVHGIRGSLLADESGGPVTDAQRRAAAAAATGAAGGRAGAAQKRSAADPTRRTGILRSSTALRAGTAALRPSPARPAGGSSGSRASSGPTKAPPPPVRLSAEGVARLEAELLEMTTVVRPAIVKRIASARELGDLKENSDYHEARREQSFAEGRVQQIEDLLRRAVLIPADESADGGGPDGASGGVDANGRARGMETRRATIGSTVVVEDPHGEEATYRIVGPAEADVGAGRISDVSPLGAALLGRAAGEEVEIVVPSGRRVFRVVEVR